MTRTKCPVLIADAQKDDRLLLKLVIRRRAPTMEIVAEVPDPQSLVHYLAGTGPYSDRSAYPYPELLILGSGMFSEDGLDVIEWIRAQNLPPMKIAVLAEPLPEEQRPDSTYSGSDYLFSKTCELQELERIVKLLEMNLVSNV